MSANERAEWSQRPFREIDLDLVRRVFCATPGQEDGGVGTAWLISQNTFVTAAHVAQIDDQCVDVDSKVEMKIVYIDRVHDLTIMKSPTIAMPEYIRFSCEGFHRDQGYISTGWAGGEKFKQTFLQSSGLVTASATTIAGIPSGGLRYLRGTIYQGMSGGPVFDDHGVAIGINSATDQHGGGFARDLKDTILCQVRKANPYSNRQHRVL